jgi:diaminohydroxyphosphoribosylaminopyrimidine deaminase / 5-amino-6-(5-phosphoribosylamino)uracil reductase
MISNEAHIRRTFELARLGNGSTFPNPLVGAVLVKAGKIIGEGHHHFYGGDHAEVDALNNCTESVAGATLYVNLEPCCHTDKQTPPCAQRLIREGIKKVVICNLDPNPRVLGKGVELLRAAGIEVEHGILAAEGEALNEVFFHAQRKQRPFVHLKLASSLDGRIALPSGESQWITGEEARARVQEMRRTHQAVAVGAETLRQDDPSLTVRLSGYQGPQPCRIVFSQSGELPAAAKLFTDEHRERTLVYSQIKREFNGVQSVTVANLSEALQDMYQRKIISVLLEGGSRLAAAFLQAGLVDRVSVFLNPSFLGAGPAAVSNFGLTQLAQRPRLVQTESCWLGADLLLSGRIDKGN